MPDNRQITSYHKHDDLDHYSKEREHSNRHTHSRGHKATTGSQLHRPGNLHSEMHGYKDHRTDSKQPVYAVHGVNFTMNGFWYKGFCKLFLIKIIISNGWIWKRFSIDRCLGLYNNKMSRYIKNHNVV